MSDTPLFVTVHELSERTGLPVPFLNTEAEAGRIPTKKIGRRTFFDVDAAVRTLTDPNAIERLTAERDEARRERDEARREVCQKHEHGYFTDEDYAEVRGWDCFKEMSR